MSNARTAVQPRSASRRQSVWAWARALGGVAILATLVWKVGAGPFLDGVQVVDGPAAVAALGIGVVTTVCSAWRWSLVAAGFGVRLPMRDAVAAYYRAQFLNTTLPGGVLGDVHRAVRHGKDIGDVGLGVRAVMLERFAGLAVLVVMTTVALFAFPSPVRSRMPVVILIVGAAGLAMLGVLSVTRTLSRSWSSRWARALRKAAAGVRNDLFAHRSWMGILLASGVVTMGCLATFLLAARTAGSTAELTRLVPLTLLALLAMGLPVSVAGWGPREGVAAWAFGAAGLSATQGVATAVTYGVLAFIATLPGAGVLVWRWISDRPEVGPSPDPAQPRVPAYAQDGAHG